MNKQDFISMAAEKADMTKRQVSIVLEACIDSIQEALAMGEKVSLVGFGTFEVKERSARIGVNPATRGKIQIEASKVPSFKPGKALKAAVNNGQEE